MSDAFPRPPRATVALPAILIIVAVLMMSRSLQGETKSDVHASRPDTHRYGGTTLAEWKRRLVDFDARSAAAARAVLPLMDILADEQVDDVTRRNAAIALGNIGEPAGSAAPRLVRMLAGGEDGSLWAAKALSLMGPAARDATPALARIVGDEKQPLALRQLALEALGRIAGAHPDAVPALVRMVGGDHELAVRTLAVEAIGVAGRDAAVAGPILIRIIRNPREGETIRRQSVVALGKLGDQAIVATAPLAEALVHDESEAVRDAAAQSLVSLGRPGSALLLRFLKHEDAGVRWRAAMGLGEVKQLDPSMRADLRAALADDDQRVQFMATKSLARHDAELPQVRSTIIQLLQSGDRTIRVDALELLASLGEKALPVSGQLEELLQSDRAEVRRIAELAMRRIREANTRD